MKKLRMVIFAMVGMAVLLMACSKTSVSKAETQKATKPLRVGVYDSRCVAVACGPTERFNQQVKEKMKEMEKAKAAGDQQKIKELNEWGENQQQKMHLMAFGTAPVKDSLEPIKERLADVAKQAGVDIIVSKWQIDYQAKDAEWVDVTDAIVALYQPSAKTLKRVEGIKKYKPFSEEKILKIKD